jgi:hypothetical protein
MCASRWPIALVLVLTAVHLPGPGLAQWLPANSIGVFFDMSGISICATPAPYTTLTAYVLALNISEASGLSGWECSLITDPATFPAGATVTLDNGGTNALAEPDYAVTLPAAVPRAPIIRLATWTSFYLGGQILFGIGPAHPGRFPDRAGPGYSAGDDPSLWVRLSTFCGSPAQPDAHYVAGVHTLICSVDGDPDPCRTPIAETTWGAVKDLYR